MENNLETRIASVLDKTHFFKTKKGSRIPHARMILANALDKNLWLGSTSIQRALLHLERVIFRSPVCYK